MKKFIIFIIVLGCALNLPAQVVFKASVFGCMSDGITVNTNSIQTAINTISERGGGSLHFYVGRYLTGTVYLKNNVTIVLHEGATLVGVPSAYDYSAPAGGKKGIIVAEGQFNIGVTGDLPEYPATPPAVAPEIVGMGVIQGWGAKVQQSVAVQREKGYLKGSEEDALPALISFAGCTNVNVSGLDLQGAAGDVLVFTGCKDLTVKNHLISSIEVAGSDGVVFSGCDGLTVTNNFFNVSGTAFKSANNSKGVKTDGNKSKKGLLPKVTK
ncbi:hypothetical protein FACS1894181_16730 [Bacteroidia bacterium]|nr:hypothetical protein FACS1894181_16730 [Bacteroidia bacterium]